jgi:hypothetical protein
MVIGLRRRVLFWLPPSPPIQKWFKLQLRKESCDCAALMSTQRTHPSSERRRTTPPTYISLLLACKWPRFVSSTPIPRDTV